MFSYSLSLSLSLSLFALSDVSFIKRVKQDSTASLREAVNHSKPEVTNSTQSASSSLDHDSDRKLRQRQSGECQLCGSVGLTTRRQRG